MKTLILAQFTLREAVRKRAVLGGLVLTVIFLALYWLGMYFALSDINQHMSAQPQLMRSITGELLLAGLYFVNFIGGLLAIFSAVGTISSEVDQGTLHAIVPKPLRRWELVIGKWLGFAIMLAAYVVATSLVAILIVYLQSGYLPPHPVGGVALIVLNALLLLCLTVLGTSSLSTVTNGIIVFMLYALALAGGRMEQLGTLIHNDTLMNIGIGTSLIIPSDALWRKAAGLMSGGGFFSGAASNPQPGLFTVTEPPSDWMVTYAVAYAAVALILATLAFRSRDL